MAKAKSLYPKHIYIPDMQCQKDVPTNHIAAASRYILEKRPDTLINAGDTWDMPSLSSYDGPAKKGFNQLDYEADIEAGNEGLRLLDSAIDAHNKSHPRRKQYKPKRILTLGNHENRIWRAADDQPWMRNTMMAGLQYGRWEPIPFLQPIIIDGISYCHYYCRNAKGKVTRSKNGQASAMAQVVREGISATAGHAQGLDVHIQPIGDGTRRRGIIAGSFYQHEPSYMTPQGQNHWRGILVKHEVRDGDYDLLEVSLDYLLRAYT